MEEGESTKSKFPLDRLLPHSDDAFNLRSYEVQVRIVLCICVVLYANVLQDTEGSYVLPSTYKLAQLKNDPKAVSIHNHKE